MRKTAIGSSDTTNRRRLGRLGIIGLGLDGRWLDLGAGDGNLVTTLTEMGVGNVVAVEYQLALIDRQRSTAPTVCGSAVAVPLDSGSFDVVIVMDVLHHLTTDDLGPALDEVHRVLRPGGALLVCEPAQTLVRRLLSLALMSPLSNLTAFSRDKRTMVEAEADTLYPWLERERSFASAATQHGFDVEMSHRGAMSTLIRLRRR